METAPAEDFLQLPHLVAVSQLQYQMLEVLNELAKVSMEPNVRRDSSLLSRLVSSAITVQTDHNRISDDRELLWQMPFNEKFINSTFHSVVAFERNLA